jgi:hypothetical protein
MPTGLTCAASKFNVLCILHLLISVKQLALYFGRKGWRLHSPLLIRRWLIQKDNSNLTVHAAAMYHGNTICPPSGKRKPIGIKKACGNEAIGEDSRPAGLIHNLLISGGKGKEKK